MEISEEILNKISTTVRNYLTNTNTNSNKSNFNYKGLLTICDFINTIIPLNSLGEEKEKNLEGDKENKLIKIAENILPELISFKLDNKIIQKSVHNDEILKLKNLIKTLAISKSPDNLYFSLNKLFMLYVEDSDFINEIMKPYIFHNEILTEIFLKSLQTYYNNFNTLPIGFPEEKITEFYYKNLRENLFQRDSLEHFNKNFELIYFLCKRSSLEELQADLISKLGEIRETKNRLNALYKFHLCDFLISNNLEKNSHEIFNTIYNKIEINSLGYTKKVLFRCLAYLKEGNTNIAIKDIFDYIEKRTIFLKNNDQELMKLISKVNNPDTFKPLKNQNQSEKTKDKDTDITYINLDSDFIPFIENIKTNLFDLINYESTFITKKNLYLAKENIIEKIKTEKENKMLDNNTNNNNFAIKLEEENYYNEKINSILFNISKIKKLANSKENDKIFNLKIRPSKDKKINPLEEIKFYIYSRYEDMEKFFFELGRTLRININKVEDLENLKFTRAEEKVGLIKNIEKKIRDNTNVGYKIGNYEAKIQNRFYSNLIKYIESKNLTFDSDVILSEDMLNYLENPEIVVNKKIDEEKYLTKARKYFSEKNKKINKGNKSDLFVLENLDYLRDNLKIDLENFSMKFNFHDKENPIDGKLLRNKIEYYEKNLSFLKELYNKTKLADLRNKDSFAISENKNDALLKKVHLFAMENSLENKSKYKSSDSLRENKPGHLIHKFLKGFTERINKRMLMNLIKNPRNLNKFHNFNRLDKNIFRHLYINNNLVNKNANYFLDNFAEMIILPKINSKKTAVLNNILSQALVLNRNIEDVSKEINFSKEEIYKEIIELFGLEFNKNIQNENNLTAKEVNLQEKLEDVKSTFEQNYDVFPLENCIYMIEFGVENNIAEGKFKELFNLIKIIFSN